MSFSSIASTDPQVTDSTTIPLSNENIASPAAMTRSPVIEQAIHFVIGCGEGALLGLAAYGIVRLAIKSGLSGMDGSTIYARSYAFRGAACVAVLKGAMLAYNTCVYAISKRDLYENLENPEKATSFDHVCHRVWKVMRGAERFFSHPVIKRVGEIATNCTVSALVGYAIYGVVRLIDKFELVKGLNPHLLRPRTYILTGLALVPAYETLNLITNVFNYFLNQREFYEELEASKSTRTLDRLGHRFWKVIGAVESVLNNPIIKRINEIVGSLIRGAVGGYIGYWAVRFLDSKKMIENPAGIVVQPLPYVLVGVITEAIIQTARLTYAAALAVIGQREVYETIADPEKAGTIDRLRQRTWKVIKRVENFQDDIDVIFSRALNVRTAKEIRASQLPDYKLFDNSETYQDIIEIARRAFADQVAETFHFVVPQEIGMYVVETLGYPILGAHAVVWLNVFGFAVGVWGKCQSVYQNMEKERLAQEKRELQTRNYCDLLELMSTNELLDSAAVNKIKLVMQARDAQISGEDPIDTVLDENQVDAVLSESPTGAIVDEKEAVEELSPKHTIQKDKLLTSYLTSMPQMKALMEEPAFCVLPDQQTDLVNNPKLRYRDSVFRSFPKKKTKTSDANSGELVLSEKL